MFKCFGCKKSTDETPVYTMDKKETAIPSDAAMLGTKLNDATGPLMVSSSTKIDSEVEADHMRRSTMNSTEMDATVVAVETMDAVEELAAVIDAAVPVDTMIVAPTHVPEVTFEETEKAETLHNATSRRTLAKVSMALTEERPATIIEASVIDKIDETIRTVVEEEVLSTLSSCQDLEQVDAVPEMTTMLHTAPVEEEETVIEQEEQKEEATPVAEEITAPAAAVVEAPVELSNAPPMPEVDLTSVSVPLRARRMREEMSAGDLGMGETSPVAPTPAAAAAPAELLMALNAPANNGLERSGLASTVAMERQDVLSVAPEQQETAIKEEMMKTPVEEEEEIVESAPVSAAASVALDQDDEPSSFVPSPHIMQAIEEVSASIPMAPSAGLFATTGTVMTDSGSPRRRARCLRETNHFNDSLKEIAPPMLQEKETALGSSVRSSFRPASRSAQGNARRPLGAGPGPLDASSANVTPVSASAMNAQPNLRLQRTLSTSSLSKFSCVPDVTETTPKAGPTMFTIGAMPHINK